MPELAPIPQIELPFLLRLLELTGVDRSTGDVFVDEIDSPLTWQEVIESAAAESGLLAESVLWSLSDAMGAADAETPLVGLRTADGESAEWFALTGRRRHQIEVIRSDGHSEK